MKMGEIIIAATDAEYAAAAQLFKEYADWLDIDLCFQDFEKELLSLPQMYAPPYGGIILYKNENDIIGCVGIRKLSPTICELKRMYVKPKYHHQGIGKILLTRAIKLAKRCGYKSIRLDTLGHMHPAIHLYKQFGFVEIAPYYHNPDSTALFFELIING
jgi:ribosomal protein S18 acetylase RimI-like enzyme